MLKYMITILGSIANIIGGYQPFMEHKNLHFDNEYDVHMSSKNYEASGYGLDLDSLAIFCPNHMFHILGEVGQLEISNHLRPIYLM
jgi:hypothetical protein